MHSLVKRVTASVPLLVTVIIHVVLIAIAGYFVTEQIIGGKKVMVAASNSEPSIAQKQVEHRLQVARKGGGSASSSPVSASRIFSTAENALQMPAMPDLPSVGASSLSGMGFGKGMGAVGTGTGYNTGGVGTSSLGSRGFMSMSFLGVTNQRSSKVVFVVDISTGLMDIKKGGFRAFEILRHEISRLVSTLPPAHSFNVVLFDGREIRLFAKELQPANVANKTAFFDWIKPINSDLSSLGASSIPASSPRWEFKRAAYESLKLDPEYGPPAYVHSIHAALEQKPDTVFVITGSAAGGQIRYSEERIARAKKAKADRLAELKAQGMDIAGISTARKKAYEKLKADLDEINRQLVAKKRDPFVVTHTQRILDPDMQAAIRKAGFTPPKLDHTGWTDAKGNPITEDFSTNVNTTHNAEFADLLAHVSKLQFGLLSERASLNVFLFVGPEDKKTEASEKNLSALASKNGGKFSLLTTKRLEEITKRAEEEAAKR